MSDGHVSDELPAYVNGTLSPRESDRVRTHVESCRGCRRELAEWEAVAGAARALVAHSAPPRIPDGVWAALDGERRAAPRGTRDVRAALSLSWQLLRGQVPLVRRSIWAASALTITLGYVVALLAGRGSGAQVLALLAPIVAAFGVAFIYGPETDPSLELALATPTSPRLVLLTRLTLVFGYDLLLALGATVALYATRGDMSPWPLISLWLGPMLFLSALSLALSVLLGPTAAVTGAMLLWAVRLGLLTQPGRSFLPDPAADILASFWWTGPALLALGGLLLALALFYAPRQERLSRAFRPLGAGVDAL